MCCNMNRQRLHLNLVFYNHIGLQSDSCEFNFLILCLRLDKIIHSPTYLTNYPAECFTTFVLFSEVFLGTIYHAQFFELSLEFLELKKLR